MTFTPFDPTDPIDPETGCIPVRLPGHVEMAPGYIIPDSHYGEFLAFLTCNSEVNEWIAEIIIERTYTVQDDPLTDAMSECVTFQLQSEMEWVLAEMLMQSPDPAMHERAEIFIRNSNINLLKAQSLLPVREFLLASSQ